MAEPTFREDGLAGLQHNFATSRLEDLVKWARRRSMFPATFGLAGREPVDGGPGTREAA